MVQFHCCVNSVMQNSLIITGKFTRTSTLYCVVHSLIDKQQYIDNDHSKDLLQDYVVLLSLIDERQYTDNVHSKDLLHDLECYNIRDSHRDPNKKSATKSFPKPLDFNIFDLTNITSPP